jgi:hypothetical protein
LPGLRAVRGSRRCQPSDTEETCGGHVINKSKNSRLSVYVLGSIRFGHNKGLVARRPYPQPEMQTHPMAAPSSPPGILC